MSSETYIRMIRDQRNQRLANEAHEAWLHEQDIVDNLNQILAKIEGVTKALAQGVVVAANQQREGRADTRSFGELAAQASQVLSVDDIVAASKESGEMETASDDVALDFSGLFESSATQSQGSYLDRTLQRIVGLVAFTPEERSAQERLLERCRALQSSTLSEEDARAAVDAETEALCQRLGEGESEQRRGAYISYLAICKLSGIEPRQQSFEAMVDETERLKESYIAREAAKEALNAVGESLEELGLSNAGVVDFDDEEGYLLVDDADPTCALFLRENEEDGSLLFTTVSAEDPMRVGTGEKARIFKSANSLCDKKRQLLQEMLPSRGYDADVIYEYDPPALDTIQKMPAFSAYVEEHERQQREHQLEDQRQRGDEQAPRQMEL